MFLQKLTYIAERYYKWKFQSNSGLWNEIQDYQQKTKSTGAKYATLFYLYKFITKTRPKSITECGTGLSTVVICHAIESIKKEEPSYNPRFVSLESEQFYWKHAVDLLPGKYKNYVDIKLASLVEDNYGMYRGVRYDCKPIPPCDFVFVDGPDYKVDKGGFSFCFDLISCILSSETPVNAVIDTRVSTVYVLQKLLGQRIVKYNPVTRVGTVKGATMRNLKEISEPPSRHFNYDFWGNLHLKIK
jgi:hypothetical protein